MSHNPESDDVFKMKRFRKMFLDYTKEFKVGVHKMTSGPTAASPVPEATTPPQTGSGKRPAKQPQSSSTATASEPSSDMGSGELTKGSKEGSNEKIADAKEFAKQDDEEFENDGGTTTMAHSKIRNRNLQWKGSEREEKKEKEQRKSSDKRSGSGSKDREATSPYSKSKERNPYEARSIDLDEGIRKRRKNTNRRKKNALDKSGKSGRSGKTDREKRSSNQRRKGTRAKDDGTEARSPGRRSSPIHSSPVKTEKETAESPLPETAQSVPAEPAGAARPATTPTDDKKIECAEIDPTSADFKTAIKLMEILKRNNILENALFPAQNETLRSFFEGGMKNPDRKIMELISKAMDFVLDAVFFKGEDMDCFIDNELKTFIVDRFKSKPILLDVIISRPEFLPQSWGGRTVVLRQNEATVLVQPDKKDKK